MYMEITLDQVVQNAKNIATFYFKPEKPVIYTAGQFVELTLPHKNPDNRGIKRWFTLSSSPTSEKISITTKFSEHSSSTFKLALSKLAVGDKLSLSEPMGDFVLPKLIQTPLIFVAGGIGITPFLSMLQWLTQTHEARPIKLLQAVATEDEIAFQDILDAAGQHATIVVSDPSPAWGGEHGHLSAEMIIGLKQPSDDTLIYVAGPEPLVETLTKDLIKTGVKKNQIVADYFPGYPSD